MASFDSLTFTVKNGPSLDELLDSAKHGKILPEVAFTFQHIDPRFRGSGSYPRLSGLIELVGAEHKGLRLVRLQVLGALDRGWTSAMFLDLQYNCQDRTGTIMPASRLTIDSRHDLWLDGQISVGNALTLSAV